MTAAERRAGSRSDRRIAERGAARVRRSQGRPLRARSLYFFV
jgi:hypothetical protein